MDADDFPDEVLKERPQWGWFHDPDQYDGGAWGDDLVPIEQALGSRGPCPACFPDTEFAEDYEVQQVTYGGETGTEMVFTGSMEELKAKAEKKDE